MSVLKGDYIGFSYGINPETGKPMHSSDLGIVRTSDGSRFNENLLPTLQDKTVQVPGGDGTYYFGSYFTQRQIPVSFAFDSLTEEQVAMLKRHFGDKKIHDLIFDERPYKVYRAKVTGTATLKYIPFAEGDTNRLYKGEGTIQFTCYDPYAICTKKWLKDYREEGWKNIDEWKGASGLLEEQTSYDSLEDNEIKLYNPGDLESHFQLTVRFENGKIPASKIYISGDSSRQLSWNEISAQTGDAYIKINSKLNLIEGYNSEDKKSGNVYNKDIAEGAFFKIPQGESTLMYDFSNGDLSGLSIDYNYYYL